MPKRNIDEEDWLLEEKQTVEEYLKREKIDHLGVGDYPAFHVHPYVALWAVQSKKFPGRIGWWSISGDLPTDYISGDEGRHPREALRAFSRHWEELAACMLRGEKHTDYSIGTPDQWPELGDLLQRRARIIAEWANDESLWIDSES
jgi:hypothetical protein